MNIVLSAASDEPIYQQLFDQLSAQILSGELESGASLPPIRTVALELRISVITVKRAWEELERNGLIDTIVGKGCFVASVTGAARQDKRKRLAEDRFRADSRYYRLLRLGKDELHALVEQLYTEE